MEVSYAEAQLCVDGETTIGCEDADAGGLEGVVGREDELAMINASLKVCAFGALQHKVPLEQVVWQRVCLYVGHRLLQATAAGQLESAMAE